MTSVVFAIAVLVVAGLTPALALIGPEPRAVALAPLVTALIASAAGMLALTTRTSVLPWAAAGVVGTHVAAWRALAARARPEGQVSAGAAGLVMLAACYPLLGLRAPDAGWDARSIWFLHARWFYGGGSYLHSALGNRAYLFSHPDYPPLIPATTGALWRMAGTVDLRVGQTAVTTMNVAAVALLGLAFLRLRAPRLVVVPVGIAVCLAAYDLAGSYSTNGYADLLWAASAAAAMIHLLILPPDRSDFAIGLVCASVAALTKNEGIPVVAVVIVLAGWRLRHVWPGWLRIDRRSHLALVAAGPLVVLAGWTVLARLSGARSDLFGGGHSGGPLATSHDTWGRLSPTWHSVWVWCHGNVRLAVAMTAMGFAFAGGWRRRLGMGSSLWSAVVVAGALAALVGAYVASPYDLGWHLGTSLDRTTIAPRLLLTVEVACWVVCLAAALPAPKWRRRQASLSS